MRVVFVADLFSHQLNGGAENNDSVLVDYLSNSGLSVEKVHSYYVNEEIINENDLFIIGNFINLKEQYKQALLNKNYIIYEHDHKYLKSRDPSVFPEFVAPENQIINKEFYKSAKAVVVLSSICKRIIEESLNINNVYNIGCSLWSDERLDYIASLLKQKKNRKFAILDSKNSIKNTGLAIRYCTDNNIDFDLIKPCGEKELLLELSKYEGLVFLPGVLETFSRISAEAKMLNCKLITKPKMLGFASEEAFNLTGVDLIKEIRKRKNKALLLFKHLLEK